MSAFEKKNTRIKESEVERLQGTYRERVHDLSGSNGKENSISVTERELSSVLASIINSLHRSKKNNNFHEMRGEEALLHALEICHLIRFCHPVHFVCLLSCQRLSFFFLFCVSKEAYRTNICWAKVTRRSGDSTKRARPAIAPVWKIIKFAC